MLHIKADSVFRQKRSDEKFDFAAVARYLGAFAECTDELVNEAPRRRGPPDTFALTVSAAIAKAYWEAFEQWPGGGRRWKNARETPYHRICDVVEYPRRRCLTLLATLLWIWPVSWHRDGDRCRSGLVYSTMLIPKLTVEVGSLKML